MYRLALLIIGFLLFIPKIAPCNDARLPGLIDIPNLKTRGFSDIGYHALLTDNEDDNSFALGAVDLFISSKIAEKVSFLAETLFEFDSDTNTIVVDLERATLKYSLSDVFNIKIGRMHTSLGYWNQTFHHGVWLQASVMRPLIYLWEDDDGGFLPVHSVGIEFLGTLEFDALDLEYNFDVLNGRGKTMTEIQNVKDNNDSKAINFLLSLKPHFLDGLKLGANIYVDTIPPNPGDPLRIERIEERIIGGYLAYNYEGIELLGEVFNIHHADKTSGNDFDTSGYYLQAAYKMNKLTPYYRFDSLDFENGDPYFTPLDIDMNKHTLGVRQEIFTWNDLKFEYSFSDKENEDDEHSFTINLSFAF